MRSLSQDVLDDSADEVRSVAERASGPIGVFDSGIGGLTVASALREVLPHENILYIGDTARVPYGGKSAETIERYAVEIGGMLLAEGAKAIVVACNTASALAIARLREIFAVPVIGVIEPGARAAASASANRRVGIIGTRATVRSGAYERNIQAIDPSVQVFAQACPLLVPLIEEGWLEDQVTDSVIQRYLSGLLLQNVDTIVLGCTHYPLLRNALERFVGPSVRLVDSAMNCAEEVRRVLSERHLLGDHSKKGELSVSFTDPSGPFLRVASEALGLDIRSAGLKRLQTIQPA
jgi:glutamate racemase